jgi:tetratricopeptide (TPR) repeat protein
MSTKELLSDVLRELLKTSKTGVTRLSRLSGVPPKTINHWCSGHVAKPRHWQDVVRVAAALQLDEAQADRLLLAAGHKRLRHLRASAGKDELSLISRIAGGVSSTQTSHAPFTAPADLATFVGRTSELATLRAALLDQGQAAICGVHGMGGVGKTALAIHLAYQLRDAFPQGVLWARLDVSDTLTVLSSFAGVFGIDVSQYRDVESRAAAVRGFLAGKRVLLILDNAESSAQVRPLLPPSRSGCAVLVTTRHDLPVLDGWSQFQLNVFEDDSTSLLLFERYLGKHFVLKNAPLLRELSVLLGQLPLALSIVAGLLSWQSHATKHAGNDQHLIRTLLDDLRREDLRLARLQREDQSVRVSFGVSFASLRNELKLFFAQLSVFGGQDFSAIAAAAATGVEAGVAEHHLSTLISRSLVQSTSGDRYQLHPLLRDYAREQLAEMNDETSKAVYRSMQFFSTHLNRHHGALSVIEPEVSNVMHLLNSALTPANAEVALNLSQAFYPYIEARGLFTWAKGMYSRACQIAELTRNKKALALSLRALASTMLRLGEFDEVIDTSTRGIQIASEIEEHEIVIQFMVNIGSAHFGRGHFQEALDIGQESLDFSRRINSEQLIASRLITVGTTMSNLGDIQKGRELLQEGKVLAARIGDKASLLVAYNNLSSIEFREQHYESAAALLQEGIDLAREMGQKERLAILLINYGNANSLLGNIGMAERVLAEGLQIALELAMPWMISLAHCNWADHYRRANQLDLAEQSAMEALSAGERINSDHMIANALFALAQIRALQGQRLEAQSLANDSFELFARNQPNRATEVHNWLAAFKHG